MSLKLLNSFPDKNSAFYIIEELLANNLFFCKVNASLYEDMKLIKRFLTEGVKIAKVHAARGLEFTKYNKRDNKSQIVVRYISCCVEYADGSSKIINSIQSLSSPSSLYDEYNISVSAINNYEETFNPFTSRDMFRTMLGDDIKLPDEDKYELWQISPFTDEQVSDLNNL